jgi:dipeptidyl aminopeptidase/acylaminoacyl peptidase
MKTSDDLDTRAEELGLRLSAWMAATAPTRLPAGLVAGAVGRTATVRQRSALLVRSGLPVVVPRARAVGPRWSTVVVLILMAVALIGGGLLLGARMFRPAPDEPTLDLHLAYELDGDIIVAGGDGSNPVVIAAGDPRDAPAEQFFWIGGGAWSPDGQRLVYHGAVPDPSGPLSGPGPRLIDETVYVADPDGTVIASFPGVGGAWSPDGTRLATWAHALEADVDSGARTVEIRRTDGDLVATIPAPAEASRAGGWLAWTPEGGALLAGHQRSGPGDVGRLWRLPLDGTAPAQVLVDGAGITRLTFSPDGAFAFVQPESGAGGPAGLSPRKRYLVSVIDDASSLELATELAGGSLELPPNVELLWSPTGKRVAYARWIGGVDVVDLQTGKTARLSVPGWPVELLAWSSDGERLLVGTTARSPKDRPVLWSVPLDASPPIQLVSGTGSGDW